MKTLCIDEVKLIAGGNLEAIMGIVALTALYFLIPLRDSEDFLTFENFTEDDDLFFLPLY